MLLKPALIAPIIALAFALSPAVAGHPDDGADHKADQSSDDHAGHCAQAPESGNAEHKDHADHDHKADAEGHEHECEDDHAAH